MDPMNEDIMEGIVTLAETLQTGLLDVQADAASAIAGLTSDGEIILPSPLSSLKTYGFMQKVREVGFEKMHFVALKALFTI